jgi:prepilin-type N-terminal cleavage/methylation domain-containing protein
MKIISKLLLEARLSYPRPDQKDRAGFTFTELLVAIAVVGILALMVLPALARTSPNSQAMQCMNNLRQITAAWKMYADDNQDYLVASLGTSGFYNGRPVWMTGNISGFSPSGWDINIDIVKSPLWVFVGKQASVFKCPADRTTVTIAGVVYPRVRSISMSQVFDSGTWLTPGSWRTYAKISDIIRPANTFVFADESPESINDGALAVQCDGSQGTSGTPFIIDVPANYHNKAGDFSFADGHSQIHKWQGGFIGNFSGGFESVLVGGDLADFNWLAQNTTVKK